MYPVLKIMHMLNFLDTFSMGVIGTERESIRSVVKSDVYLEGEVSTPLYRRARSINASWLCGV